MIYGTSWVAMGIALESFTPVRLPRSGARWSRPAARAAGRDRACGARRPWRLPSGRGWSGCGDCWSSACSVARCSASDRTYRSSSPARRSRPWSPAPYPVVAGAAAPLVLHERPRPAACAGIALAFIGTVLIAGVDLGGTNWRDGRRRDHGRRRRALPGALAPLVRGRSACTPIEARVDVRRRWRSWPAWSRSHRSRPTPAPKRDTGSVVAGDLLPRHLCGSARRRAARPRACAGCPRRNPPRTCCSIH